MTVWPALAREPTIYSDQRNHSPPMASGRPKRYRLVDILVQAKRNRTAAERFFRYRIHIHGAGTLPHTLVNERLRSDSAALPRVLPKLRHKRGHWHNNRAENSHQPTVNGSGACRFQSPEQAQQFLSVQRAVASHVRPRRHRLTAARYRGLHRQCPL
jgi:putative transposase